LGLRDLGFATMHPKSSQSLSESCPSSQVCPTTQYTETMRAKMRRVVIAPRRHGMRKTPWTSRKLRCVKLVTWSEDAAQTPCSNAPKFVTIACGKGPN